MENKNVVVNRDARLIVGDEDNNNLIGTTENDILEGLEGNDTLNGNAGNDYLDGGSGNNTLYGGTEDDTLVNRFGYVDGNLGNDILTADYSDYEVAINNIESSSQIKRGDNNDSLIYYYNIENYQIIGTAFNDSLQGNGNDSLDGGEGIDRLNLDLSTETEAILVDLTTTDNQVIFENTEVKNFETIRTIYVGSNNDSVKLGLTAATSSGYVDGLSGNDTLTLDYFDYESAIQNINSSSRIERIDNDVDLIYYYNIEHYQITGTEFNDSLRGSINNDTLVGGSGDDDLRGNGNDNLDGGEGVDRLSLDFSTETVPISIDLTTTDNQVIFENTEVKNFETIGTIYVGSNSDIITLGLPASTSGGYVDGLYGNDTLTLDYFDYESAIQNINSSSRIERIDNDVDLIYYYNIEHYQITGTEFNDSLRGSSNSDTLVGGSGKDSIQGHSGEDIITGVNPNLESAGLGEIDTLVGGANSDYFLLGDIHQTFYDDGESRSRGLEDYALIKDFDVTEDIIEISGSKTNYRLGFSPIRDITGTAIYRVGNIDETDELIAILEDVIGLNINSDAFSSIVDSTKNDLTGDGEGEVEIVTEDEVEIVTEDEDTNEKGNVRQLDAYQISRLSVGLDIDTDDFLKFETIVSADMNQDGVISALDAYLAYSIPVQD
ncbi:hypothetical protein H1P_690003 [Hyella patelloides LEGE 07179]|uniref:Uncharacterized protein n=1 Tax=Hyella patelloides LEGE 07179 TaxID=945734 RepID=A0A563W3F4_9CYAN|nr:calcium-binding protein [Hyella patelloides]VEP18083.1 hypothetical protein H1P_690003 [Hyella patelloides LEGE 07179]